MFVLSKSSPYYLGVSGVHKRTSWSQRWIMAVSSQCNRLEGPTNGPKAYQHGREPNWKTGSVPETLRLTKLLAFIYNAFTVGNHTHAVSGNQQRFIKISHKSFVCREARLLSLCIICQPIGLYNMLHRAAPFYG